MVDGQLEILNATGLQIQRQSMIDLSSLLSSRGSVLRFNWHIMCNSVWGVKGRLENMIANMLFSSK